MNDPQGLGILFIDDDTGRGGASRSLLLLAQALKRAGARPVVALSPANPLIAAYRAADIPAHAVAGLPRFRPSERKAWVLFLLFLWRMRRWRALRRRLGDLVEAHGVDLLHANHENVAVFTAALARSLGKPLVCHMRTLLYPTIWARAVVRHMNRRAAHIIFIAEPVEAHYRHLLGATARRAGMSVIHNLPPPIDETAPPHPDFLEPADALRVLSLGNFSPNRGIDRVVEVAAALRERGRVDFCFFLCGAPAHRNLRRPGEDAPYYDTIVEDVTRRDLGAMVRFPGHVDDALGALKACHVLIRLTRLMPSPWGRDVIEALCVGRPVVTVGAYHGFVEPGVTGYVEDSFEPGVIAERLIALRDDPALRARMERAARAKASALFDPDRAAARQIDIYRNAIGSIRTQA